MWIYTRHQLSTCKHGTVDFPKHALTSMSSLKFLTGILPPSAVVRDKEPVKPLMFPLSCHENGFLSRLSIWKRKKLNLVGKIEKWETAKRTFTLVWKHNDFAFGNAHKAMQSNFSYHISWKEENTSDTKKNKNPIPCTKKDTVATVHKIGLS